ncbi:hypothetical protein H8959_007017, partial [Pygathrix nigripes]
NNQPALTVVRPGDTARDTLELICKTHQLDHSAHYLRLKFLIENKMQHYVPQPEEDIYELLYKEIEICPKVTQSIHIEKSDTAADTYGFLLSSVEEDGIRRLYVNSVKETGLASKKGLKAGDEILEINNRAADALNSSMLKDFLSQPSLGLLVRTYPELEEGVELLESPPHRVDGPADLGESPLAFLTSNPGHSLCSEQGSSAETAPEETEGPDLESSDETDHSSKSTEQVAAFCRSLHEMNPSDQSPSPQDSTGPQLATMRQLSDADKLRKVICELLETERTYVKDLNCLMERYLKPLQKETFLTQDELDVLFGNLTEMVEFQVEFLKTLEDGVRLVPDLEKLEKVDQFKVADLSMGDLLLHTTVIWLNPPASLGKWKKEPELAAFVFKTAVVLVYKDGSKQKKKLVGSHRLSIYEDWDPCRFRHMIPTEALQVRALASADADTNAVCEIVHVKSESEGRPERAFHLCCSSPESRKDFLKAVHSVLRDKHRRQLLKTESLPSSQQYVPFGGKRLCALKGARPAMSRAVSAPSKSLGRRRRRLARNRFTIDSDAVSASSPEKESQQPPGGGDTDRWVEEQFDLAQYEEQDDIKETDILSDDDEFCESVKGASVDRDLQERLQAASISQRERGRKTLDSHASRMAQLKKQAALSGINGGLESASEEVIWVRREDFAPSRKLNTEI